MSVVTHTTADGFITADDTDFLTKVVQTLEAVAPTLSPQLWHSGGGNFGVQIEESNGATLLWGECDGYWVADVTDAEGEMADPIMTDFSFSPADNLQHVADMIRTKSQII